MKKQTKIEKESVDTFASEKEAAWLETLVYLFFMLILPDFIVDVLCH